MRAKTMNKKHEFTLNANPEEYRHLSQPFLSEQDVDRALGDFYRDLKKLRTKYRIPDISISVMVQYENRSFISSIHWGDPLRAEPMLTYALGKVRAAKDDFLRSLLGEYSSDGELAVNADTQTDSSRVVHGSTCKKELHNKIDGYLHDESDDMPYVCDGVAYCGRCHYVLDDWRA